MASGRVRIGCKCRNTLFIIASERPRTEVGQPLRTIELATSSQVRLPRAFIESIRFCTPPGSLLLMSFGLGKRGALLERDRAITVPPPRHQMSLPGRCGQSRPGG